MFESPAFFADVIVIVIVIVVPDVDAMNACAMNAMNAMCVMYEVSKCRVIVLCVRVASYYITCVDVSWMKYDGCVCDVRACVVCDVYVDVCL